MSTPKKPFVSIIMPSFNQDQFILETINSIYSQNYPRLEIIVADGNSNKKTKKILSDLSEKHDNFFWFSEPDNGPAQALNRALSQTRGTIIGWLNTDDLYAAESIHRAVESLNQNTNLLMVYGQAQHIDKYGKFINDYPTLPPPANLNDFEKGCFICQPTVFFKKTLPILIGDFDESLKTAFDFDYWLRIFSNLPDRIGFINEIQAYSRLHDQCITLNQRKLVILEGMQLLKKYLGYAPKEWALTYIEELANKEKKPKSKEELQKEILSFLYDSSVLMNIKSKIELTEILTHKKIYIDQSWEKKENPFE